MKYVLAKHRPDCPSVPSLIASAVEALQKPRTPYTYSPEGAMLECFANVSERVKQSGGKAVFGWSVINLKDALSVMVSAGIKDARKIRGIEMETHCVWKTPEGELIDISQTEGEDRCEFVRDDSVPTGVGIHIILFGKSSHRESYREIFKERATRLGCVFTERDIVG